MNVCTWDFCLQICILIIGKTWFWVTTRPEKWANTWHTFGNTNFSPRCEYKESGKDKVLRKYYSRHFVFNNNMCVCMYAWVYKKKIEEDGINFVVSTIFCSYIHSFIHILYTLYPKNKAKSLCDLVLIHTCIHIRTHIHRFFVSLK